MKEMGRTIWFVKTPVPIQMIRTVSLETVDVLTSLQEKQCYEKKKKTTGAK